MKITKLFIPILLLLSLFTGIIPKPVEALTLYPGVYYHSGYTNYTVGHAMVFSLFAIEPTLVVFNDTTFLTTATPATTPVNITLNYLHPHPDSNNTPGTLLLNFTAKAPLGTTPVTFTIGGFPIGYNYTINKNETLETTSSADIHGNISFTNSSGTWNGYAHNYTIYLSTITATYTRNPVQIKANWTTTTSVNLEWKKGANTTNTLIIRKTGSYPATTTDGTIIYNGTAISYNNTGLNPSIRYFYKAYGWSSSLSYSSGVNIAFVETDNTTVTTSSSATFKGYLTTDHTMQTGFRYGLTPSLTVTPNNVTLPTECQNTSDTYYIFYENIVPCQTFTTKTTRFYLYNISLLLRQSPTVTILTVKLYNANTSTGQPNGPILSQGTKDISGITTASGGEWVNITMSNYYMLTNTRYAIVLSCPGGSGHWPWWRCNSDPSSYAYGISMYSYDSGATWTNFSDRDWAFRIYGHFPGTSSSYTNNITLSSTSDIAILQNNFNPGTMYYYMALADDSKNNMTKGNIRTTLTNPDIPIFMTIVPYYSNFSVKITWITGTGANRTVAVLSHLGYPVSTTDGTIVYNGTGASCWITNITFNSSYYFSLFSYTVWDGLYRFSSGVHVPWGGLRIMVYNESNPAQSIGFNMLITNNNLYSYYINDTTGPLFINITDIPFGTNTVFFISNSSYNSRIYTLDILGDTFYQLNFYLPYTSTPSSPVITYAYGIFVYNIYGDPINNAHVSVKRHLNGTFEEITSGLTGANGGFNTKLYSGIMYVVLITKTGYQNSTNFLLTSDSVFSITYTLDFIESTPTTPYNAADYITFAASFSTNTTLSVLFSDSSGNTSEGRITIYQNGTLDVYNISLVNSSYSFIWVGGNHSVYNYEIVLNIYNHSMFGNYTDVILIGTGAASPIIAPFIIQFDLPDLTTVILQNPLGWVNSILFFFGIMLIVTFGRAWAGIGIMSLGGLIFIFELIFGLPVLTVGQLSVIPLLLLYGALVQIAKSKKETRF